jgi:hypothetical protein
LFSAQGGLPAKLVQVLSTSLSLNQHQLGTTILQLVPGIEQAGSSFKNSTMAGFEYKGCLQLYLSSILLNFKEQSHHLVPPVAPLGRPNSDRRLSWWPLSEHQL